MIVYTASHGIKVKPQSTSISGVDEWICFSVEKPPHPWTWVKLKKPFSDPCRNAKMPKILPWLFLPKTWTESLWIDANMTLVSLPKAIPDDVDFAIHRHSKRNCVYDEAEACIRKKKDNTKTITDQINKYRLHGFPPNFGLFECGVIYRKNTIPVRRICEQWEVEITLNSRRDQLSLPYILWAMGFRDQSKPRIYSLGNNYRKTKIVK